MDALVTDAETRAAVAALRGLGRAGLRIIAAGSTRSAPGLWSTYCTKRTLIAAAGENSSQFVEDISRAARKNGPLVVYPSREESVDALLGGLASLPPEFVLPYPSAEVLHLIRDKSRLERLARDVGLRTPATFMTGSASELADASITLPCVVKAMRKGGSLAFPKIVNSPEELRALVRGLPEDEQLLAQEPVDGPLRALALVLGRDGQLVAHFHQVARRTWPRSAGPSCLAVSVQPDDEFAQAIARMLSDVGFWGLAQIQFFHTREGPALIDINPRFYGSMPLAMASGMNLPAIWHAVATDGPLPRSDAYAVGVTYRWLEADILSAIQGRPRRLFQRVPKPRTGAMWASDDPLAASLLGIAAMVGWLRRQVARGL